MKKYPCVVTIAGSDSSGGAGIQADIKTMSAIGCYAASVITALTAQNTQGVQAIFEITADFVRQQIDSVFNDLNIKAVKIGMLFNREIIAVIAAALQKYKPFFVVLDPVMIAKSGDHLLQPHAIELLKQTLMPLTHLITPNIPETEALLNIKIKNAQDMETAAKQLGAQVKTNILVKGGHLLSDKSSDLLYEHHTQNLHWLESTRITTKNTHGTGCTLSSAIASFIALDNSLYDAVRLAKDYLTQAIIAGSKLTLGKGQGPVNHFWRFCTV